MAVNHIEDLKRCMENTGKLGEACPDVMGAFMQLHHAAVEEGTLSTKTKELICVAISVSIRCNDCINAHVKAAIDTGASREEISEAIGVAVLMSGGPGTAYGAIAIEAMDQFLAE
ncbi:MAG TPA: carboxymuconolactone decarboxylase family protein [Clostridia bacterium]|nr:carboxymuconolactone decarboxylase family protein [Clostridia bacterium]